VAVGRPGRGPQAPLGAGGRHFVVPALEAEVAGQAAAAGVEDVHINAAAPQDLGVGVETHDRVLVAVDLRDGAAVLAPGGLHVPPYAPGPACLDEQFGEGLGPLGEQPGVIAGQQFRGVGAEHGATARLEHHDGNAGPEVREQGLDGAPQHAGRHAELAGGDPGEPAAHRAGGHLHLETRALEHGHRRVGDLGMEVVAEGVRPQDDAAACGPRAAACVPAGERLPREPGQVPPRVDPARSFGHI
jgi:hypothetical protein